MAAMFQTCDGARRGGITVLMLLTLSWCSPVLPLPGVLESASQKWWHGWEDAGQPSVASDQVNVTAVLGHTVTLPCRVTNLGDKTVSWIRSRDLTVLAVDQLTVTTDARFSVVHPEDTEDWLLEVRGVTISDDGTYDCQVNTHPKISTKFHLKILPDTGQVSILDIPVSDTGVISQPEAKPAEDEATLRLRVLGQRWVRLPAGGALRLVCEASGKALTELHEYSLLYNDPLISWTLDGIPVTTLWHHNKVVVRESWGGAVVESELEVRSLHPSDGGTYACVAPQAQPDRVTLTVMTTQPGERDTATSRLASPGVAGGRDYGYRDSAASDHASAAASAGAAGRAAVISGVIILLLLLVQVALCVFYIKKV
ncbi:protein amalgam isoform X2 [Procambarus clarkii]|uniref:protein amalgam isoform X2 n=1 Tax=Procambarus clarkii TaxID=6728 RepID=UPI001E675735|nr:protein amalgam-like isoform X2 [Procambarus clarkii]